MEFSDILTIAALIAAVPVVLYSWKEPLYLILLYVLFLGYLFGQVDMNNALYLQLFEGVRLYLRDFFIMLMIYHILRSSHVERSDALVFHRPIKLFLVYLVLNYCLKLIFFGSEFSGKFTTDLRLMGTFAVYFLIVNYLTGENVQRFVNACYGFAALSLLVFAGYRLGLLPLPANIDPIAQFQIGAEGHAIRLGVPNSLFLFFPFFVSIAPLMGYAGKIRITEIAIMISMAIATFASLYRMQFVIVLLGVFVALLARRGRFVKNFTIVLFAGLLAFLVVQSLTDSDASGIGGIAIERFAGTVEELQNEDTSGGGRLARTYVTIERLTDPRVFFLGAAFTSGLKGFVELFSGDLGILTSVAYYGVGALLLFIVVYRLGIRDALASLRVSELSGRVSTMLILFLVAILPAELFMYNPLQHEMMIVMWATVLGTYDALRGTGSSQTSSLVAAEVQ